MTLKWAEYEYDQPGQRVFDVLTQGQTMIQGLDLNVVSSLETAYDRTLFNIPVTLVPGSPSAALGLGTLDVVLQAEPQSLDVPFLAGIEVTGEQAIPTATFTPTITLTPTLSPTPSYTPTPQGTWYTSTSTSTPTATSTVTSTATPPPPYPWIPK